MTTTPCMSVSRRAHLRGIFRVTLQDQNGTPDDFAPPPSPRVATVVVGSQQ